MAAYPAGDLVRSQGRKELKVSLYEICPECEKDPTVGCPRNVDAKCLDCGKEFCGAHIGEHLKTVHFVSLDLDHCRR